MEQKDNETYIQRYLNDGGDVHLVEVNGQKFLQVRWLAHIPGHVSALEALQVAVWRMNSSLFPQCRSFGAKLVSRRLSSLVEVPFYSYIAVPHAVGVIAGCFRVSLSSISSCVNFCLADT